MTTRSRQKISSILAVVSIVALFLLLIFLWTAVRNGVFSPNNSDGDDNANQRFNRINISDATSKEATTLSNQNELQHTHHNHHHPHHRHHETNTTSSIESSLNTTTTSDRANLGDEVILANKDIDDDEANGQNMDVDQLVKPSKIHVQPLHADDLLYESKKFDPSADIEGKVPEHRITGQYRNKTSRIWDPHPQYLIDAFGLHLHLILYQDDSFIPKNIKITHLWHDQSLQKIEDHKDYDQLRGCFYRGRVRGDDHSAVTVSLCDGMRGHIYTSSGSFFIEPEEEYTAENQNILHTISREKLPLDKVHFDKYRNGKILIDELSNDEDSIRDVDDEDVDENINDNEEQTNDNSNNHVDDLIVEFPPTDLECATDSDGKDCARRPVTATHTSITSNPLATSTELPFTSTDTLPFTSTTSENSSTLFEMDVESVEASTNRSDAEDTQVPADDLNNNEETKSNSSSLVDQSIHHSARRRRRRHISMPGPNLIENNAYTMEVLVAVDRKMQEYHGQNIKAYVLTLMSIVSSIYADASIGNSINVAVVHILLLKDDLHVESNHIGVSASQMLSRFCKFIQHHPFHHDTALLLTREQICRSTNQMKCDTLGLAELGTMCRPSSCAIVQDNGLSAAFTIAHELGHVLSMPHDDDIKCSKFRKDGTNSQNIMSRMLDHNTHPWSWSDCSRHYVTEYLEHNRGFCMLDKPRHDLIESSSQLLAGEKFSANQQCELVFGPNSKVCPYMVTPPCGRLWCGSDSEGCRTQHMPWADGTECGSGHWCQRGKCVPRNRMALAKVDGGWGDWKPFDQCSRTCGGGVQSSTRECNSPAPANGGKYCIGTRIKYRSCNIQDCPADSLDFREEQCADMNNNNFDIQGLDANVKWVPKYGQSPHDECKLYCRVEKSNNYFLLNDKVKDGTSCSHDSFNKCVNGICRPAGCNNQLDSDAQLDKCGVCNGNNNTCMDIVGNFRPHQIEESKKYSKTPYYFYVTTIPKGASNVEILQPGYSDDLNYIALMDDQGEYILNGYNVITQYPRIFPYGGVTFEYTGTNSTLEKVNTTFARRLKRDLTVEILSRSETYTIDELIRFSYTMALNETNSHTNFYPYNYNQNQPTATQQNRYYEPPSTQYKWEMSEWSDCNDLCNGEQFRTAACVQVDDGRNVSPNQCDTRQKPEDEYQVCNTDCEIEWEIQRSKCSAECGEGVQQLTYTCVQTIARSDQRKVVDDSYCTTSHKNKLYEKCSGPCSSATWTYEEFGTCSRLCNGGVQTRTAYCTSHLRGQIIDDKFCANIVREELTRACNTHECPKWQYGDESACSVTCGTGYKIRSAICVQNNQIINAAECDDQSKPIDIRTNCSLDPCYRKNHTPTTVLYANEIPPRIINSYKSSYYNSKHETTLKPEIAAGPVYRQHWATTPSITTKFMSTTTPPTLKKLLTTTTTTTTTTTAPITTLSPVHRQNQQQRHYFMWRTSRWTPCSATCNGGVRMRSVRCVNELTNQAIDDRYCVDKKPINITNCAQQRCPKWRMGDWGQCNDDCKRYRQVVCQDDNHHINITNCPLNTRPTSVETCCHFKWRNLWSPCSVDCGTGIRSRQRVCMRLYPRSRFDDKQAPRKKGQPVDARHCEYMKQPPFEPKSKVCRKQVCATSKWDVTAWSRCSVGCGKGYSSREVKCTLNGVQVNEMKCRDLPKPIATRHCETTFECKWKTGPWKPCSCTGYTKRRVQCFDMKLNRQSNSCLEKNKPEQKRRCDQPATCSCKGLQTSQRIYKDDDYLLNVRGRKVLIYCNNMNSTNPQEFISLRNYRDNYSSYYEKRSRDENQCMENVADQREDPSIPSGLTYFSKIRVDLHSLQVIIDDYSFAHTLGKQKQPFGSAGDCFSSTQRCPQGAFSISFEHTKFRIRPKTRWETRGMNATHQFTGHGWAPPYQRVSSRCGGYCGNCFPSKDTGLYLEVL